MSGNPWSKFFWQDWESDQALRLCSLAAQGLWMRMLCIAAAHDPVGYVSVAGKPLAETDLARLTGVTESEVAILLQELDRHGVFSRDRHSRIYSRRLIRDAKKSAIAKKNGKMGGNPKLGKITGKSGQDNPQDKGDDKPHKPKARSQSIPLSSNEDNSREDPAKALWDAAVGYLGESQRSFVGGLCKAHGTDAVAQALTTAMLKSPQPPDRKAYLAAVLRRQASERAEPLIPI